MNGSSARRFVNELTTRSVVTAAIFEQGSKLKQEVQDAVKEHTEQDAAVTNEAVVKEDTADLRADPIVAYLIMNT